MTEILFGKTDHYEVIRIKEGETGGRDRREKFGECSTLPEARKLARKAASKPRTIAADIFRWYPNEMYTNNTRRKSYHYIETCEVHYGKVRWYS